MSMINEEKINWYHSPIDKETVRSLMERSDWHGFRQAIQHLMLVATTGGGAYYAYLHLSLPYVILAIFLHGTFYTFLGLGGACHELSHRTVFKTRFWNEFFMRLFSFLSWSNFVHFRASHVKHHQLTVHEGQDLEVILPAKLTPWNWLFAFTVGLPSIWLAISTTVRHSLGIIKGDWEQRIFPESNPQARRDLANWARFLLLGHLTLATLFIYSNHWILLLLVTFAPFCATWLGMLCGFPQHAGLPSNASDFRLCCRTMILSRFVSFLYWQMNYHLEHHMYASVPFYNLGKLRRSIESDLPPAPRGLWSSWKELLAVLRRQKEDPNYAFIPLLPHSKSKSPKMGRNDLASSRT